MSADKTPAKKPVKETIYIDVDDEITSIIDKVEGAKAKVVALVLPKRAATLQSIVNMRLLRRAADTVGKNVVLITSETALLPLAGAAGLHVAKNLQSRPAIPPAPGMPAEPAPTTPDLTEGQEASGDLDSSDNEDNLPQKINYEKSIGELAAVHELEHPETIEIGDDEGAVEAAAGATEKLPKAPKDKALKVPNFDRFRLWLALGIAGFVGLIVFIILALFVLPKATIEIETTSTPVSANFTLTTSGKATVYDDAKKIIPAVLKTSDQTSSQQVPATGQVNNGEKASGKVTLTNCTNNPVTIPSGTGISGGGLTYITQSSVALDSGNFTSGGTCKTSGTHVDSVNVVAQQGGAKYNGTHSSYTVAGYPGVSGADATSGGMSGGTDNIQTIVSQADIDGAKQKISSASSDTFSKNFQKTLGDQGFYVIAATLKVGDPQTTASPDVGQPASTSNVTVKITYSVLVVKKDDLKTAVTNAVADQIDKKKQKIEETDLLSGLSVSIANQTSPTDVTLNITEDTSAVPILDIAAIKKQSAGQKSATVVTNISTTAGVKNVKVKLRPFWVSKVPKSTGKITVTLHHVKESASGE